MSQNNKLTLLESSEVLEEIGAALVFYEKKEKLFFANARLNIDSQSYGEVLNLKQKNLAKGAIEWSFDWPYRNTYDDKTGTAKVVFKQMAVNEEGEILFEAEIKVPQVGKNKPYSLLLKGEKQVETEKL